jgi:membrane protein YdbS with pleckstrin-like domain
MDYLKLDPRAVKMWQAGRIFGLAILLLLYAAAGWLFFRVFEKDRLLDLLPMVLVGLAVPVVLQLLNLLLYPPLEYRQWAYLITGDRIEIKKGLFFHTTRIIPISRIQHVMVSEGPLARHYHLASVTIHTAGGSMKIEGLARETAAEICESLKSVINRKARFEPAQTGG